MARKPLDSGRKSYSVLRTFKQLLNAAREDEELAQLLRGVQQIIHTLAKQKLNK